MTNFIFVGASAVAQTVTFGVGGVGGSGPWDTSTANWFNGSQNVTWPEGGDAIFAGASGGTVTASSFDVVVSSMTFNTPGYVIDDGWIESGASGLTVTTNVDAVISSLLSDSVSSGSLLVKEGPASLSLNGTNFLDAVQVNEGKLRVGESSSLSFSEVSLADAPGVTVTLAEGSMGGLFGGGPSGGVVRPEGQPGTVTLTTGGGDFGGTLEDNGNGVLALTITGLGSQTLTNANTYSGETTVFADLVFAGNGSALNSPMTTLGTLVLDNGDTVVANRVSDSHTFALRDGDLRLEGNVATPVEEVLGELGLSGASTITVIQPGGAAAQLTFTGWQRSGHATLNVVGPGVKIEGLSNDATGIVSPYITAGTEWATVGGDGRITPLGAYASDINAGSTSDHVKHIGSGTTDLAGPTMRASLNLQNSNASIDQTLDLAGHNLVLNSGGILSSGAGRSSILNGSLSTTAQEMVVTGHNNLTIGATIADGGGATTLTKSGPGVLTLTGANTYTGPTAIMKGTLVVASDANLGLGSTIDLGGGTLKAAASFSSAKGFTSNTSQIGLVDTAGFDLVFSGPIDASLAKRGLGTLTLASEPTGIVSVHAGVLDLGNVTSAAATLFGGTLRVAGTLSRLIANATFSPSPLFLDLGGPEAATLTTDSFSLHASAPDSSLKIIFGIGSEASDFWVSNARLSPSTNPGAYQFAFHNLGGVATGVDYPLMSFRDFFTPPSPDFFAFAPESEAAGWSGIFTTTEAGVSVRFTSVPEPQVTAILLLQGALLALAARRCRRNRKTV